MKLNVPFAGILAYELLEQIGKRVAASAGAACHSGGASVSAALQAMRVPLSGSLRMTLIFIWVYVGVFEPLERVNKVLDNTKCIKVN